ncbi:hypothetical protein D187_004727 [Cystobacter fuscus DSM 2262]|uniref:Uncharacterized protein n=1 Tax=Cystobacter fuscus (strain ATCC 25194 / DSM 2262 / NBRC 100088 / M29) TaxID=1242864 RepID=S9P667_CYSF2|nr:hypothetical protein D187_004727 [Cystobacter fuscus DSM 2262]
MAFRLTPEREAAPPTGVFRGAFLARVARWPFKKGLWQSATMSPCAAQAHVGEGSLGLHAPPLPSHQAPELRVGHRSGRRMESVLLPSVHPVLQGKTSG